MRDLMTVLTFELKSMIQKKSFVMSTLVLMLITFALTFVPTLFNDELTGESTQAKLTNVGFVFHDDQIETAMRTNLDLSQNRLFETVEAMKEALNNQSIDSGYEIISLSEMKTYYLNRTMDYDDEQMVQQVLKDAYRLVEYEKLGVSLDDVASIEQVQISNTVEILGRDALSNYFINYVLSFAIYMILVLYGTTVATGIAREKDDRTMEMLVTSTKPKYLIVGKVFGITLGTLLQVGLIFLAGFIGYKLFSPNYPMMIQMFLQSSLTFDLLLIYIIFYGFGMILYMFVFSAVGSSVSRVEDVNNAVMPLMVLIMIGLFVSMFTFGNVNSTLARVTSHIPFTSFLMMPTRYLMSVVPLWELLLSMAILIVSTILMAWISIKIYRWGTLYYGNKINLFKILKQSLSMKE